LDEPHKRYALDEILCSAYATDVTSAAVMTEREAFAFA